MSQRPSVTHSLLLALGRKETALSLGKQEKEENTREKEVHPKSRMGSAAQGSALSQQGWQAFCDKASCTGFYLFFKPLNSPAIKGTEAVSVNPLCRVGSHSLVPRAAAAHEQREQEQPLPPSLAPHPGCHPAPEPSSPATAAPPRCSPFHGPSCAPTESSALIPRPGCCWKGRKGTAGHSWHCPNPPSASRGQSACVDFSLKGTSALSPQRG